MKFILKENIDKMENNVFATNSELSLKNYLINKKKEYRILYDKRIGYYFFSEAYNCIHKDLFKEAIRNGYYYEEEDFNNTISTGGWENYWEYGLDGGEINNNEFIEPYIFCFQSDVLYNEEEFIRDKAEDGYNNFYLYNNYDLIIGCREFGLKEIPLYNVLGKEDKAVYI